MVDQNFPEGADRMVIIKGQRDSVDRAAAMINELIAGEPGSASAIIAKVRRRCGVFRVLLGGCFSPGSSRGEAAAPVLAAGCCRADLGADHPVLLLLLLRPAFCPQHSIGINVTVQCPKSMVGRVIGKGGETIKGLQRKYHTSIQVGSQVRMTRTRGQGFVVYVRACRTDWVLLCGRALLGGVCWKGRGAVRLLCV